MSFVIDDANLPATLTSRPMTDDEFADFCAEHPDLSFEMTAEGEMIVMAPTHSLTGIRNARIAAQLTTWADRDGRGLTSDSSTGFVLPNGSRRSPDASWTLKGRIQNLEPVIQRGFWHLCPDFVIELQSDTARPPILREKMAEYISDGVQLGWLINTTKRSITVYRPNGEIETLTDVDSLIGEALVTSFKLDLTLIGNPLGR